ncbi:MAG: tetracycline resistance efflux pump [Flavobacteriales bacterium]|jgi:tetracycline resistance efflux pump
MIDPTWTTVLPSFVAIGLALATRQVYLALFSGVWLGMFLLAGDGFIGSLGDAIDRSVAVLASPGDARVIVFTLVIGAFIYTLERNGAVTGFVRLLEKSKWVTNAKRAQWMAFIIGIVIFIESNITVLVAGTVSRPLFDRFKIAREKLAYIIDSTSAPICILIPLNAWGAFNLGLLEGLGVEDPLKVLLSAIPMNLYAITAVLLTAYSIARGFNPPAMAQAQARTDSGVIGGVDTSVDMEDDNSVPRAINMALPIIALVLAMPIGLYFTGNGDLFAGSGSKSVLWASLTGLAVISVLALVQRNMNLTVLTTTWMQGAGRMLPLATIMLLSLALGSVAKELGTGIYIAGLIGDSVAVWLLPVIVFVTAAVIAFSVGTSWGTFSIMLPIAIPVAAAMGAEPALFVAAVLSGGIFGDHASPISDTTIISSLASGTEHIDHVKTQMPYAMSAGAISAIGFILLGIMIL